MGAHVHNTLKDYYDLLKKEQRNAKEMEKRLKERWTENRKGFTDRVDENKWGTKAVQMMRVFCASPYSKREPALLEDFYDFPIQNKFKISGRIDRADVEDEELHLIDYKTGKPDSEKSNLQLLMYAFIIQNRLKRTVAKASYWYLLDNTFHTVDIDDEMYSDLIENVGYKVDQIKSQKEFSPKINKYCKFCDFLSICPAKNKIKDKKDE